MQEVLLRKLIEKNFFKIGTEVDARHKGMGLAGLVQHQFENTFTVMSLMEKRSDRSLLLEVRSVRDGQSFRIAADQITGIDGMTPERFAENYMVDPDGGDIKVVGARRGRRPKGWNEETQMVDRD